MFLSKKEVSISNEQKEKRTRVFHVSRLNLLSHLSLSLSPFLHSNLLPFILPILALVNGIVIPHDQMTEPWKSFVYWANPLTYVEAAPSPLFPVHRSDFSLYLSLLLLFLLVTTYVGS